MPWVNLLTQYPDANFEVYRNGSYIDPADFASEGIEITTTAGRVVLYAPDIDDGGGSYEIRIVFADDLSNPVRMLNVEMAVRDSPTLPPDASRARLSGGGGQDDKYGVAGSAQVVFDSIDPWSAIGAYMQRGGD